MPKDRVTEIELSERGQEYIIEIDDRAATRQAIINNVRQALEKKYGTKFLERSAWKAQKPKNELTEEWDYDSIVIHHQGNNCSEWSCSESIEETQNIQIKHMDPNGKQRFDDIGYHYIIGKNGDILEGRDIRFIGSHVKLNNSKKIGILLLGDYSEKGEAIWDWRDMVGYIAAYYDSSNSSRVSVEQKNSCIILIEYLLSVFHINKLGGHREFSLSSDKRTCPGNIGMQFVNYLREYFNLSTPKEKV